MTRDEQLIRAALEMAANVADVKPRKGGRPVNSLHHAGARNGRNAAAKLVRAIDPAEVLAKVGGSPAVRTKPLVWDSSLRGRWIGAPPVRLGDLAFWIFETSAGVFERHARSGRERHHTLEAAKAAAQADYEARILAALTVTPQPATDAVMRLVEAETPSAWTDVMAERQRQIAVEGWAPEHDDAYQAGDLADAAACYAMNDPVMDPDRPAPVDWPWSQAWWKPTDRRRDLVKAGALILAEIERLDRAAMEASHD